MLGLANDSGVQQQAPEGARRATDKPGCCNPSLDRGGNCSSSTLLDATGSDYPRVRNDGHPGKAAQTLSAKNQCPAKVRGRRSPALPAGDGGAPSDPRDVAAQRGS